MDKLKPRGLHFFYYTLDNNLNDINKMMTRLQINNVPDSFNFVDEVAKNPLLCFSYKIINYLIILLTGIQIIFYYIFMEIITNPTS